MRIEYCDSILTLELLFQVPLSGELVKLGLLLLLPFKLTSILLRLFTALASQRLLSFALSLRNLLLRFRSPFVLIYITTFILVMETNCLLLLSTSSSGCL